MVTVKTHRKHRYLIAMFSQPVRFQNNNTLHPSGMAYIINMINYSSRHSAFVYSDKNPIRTKDSLIEKYSSHYIFYINHRKDATKK